MLTKNAYAFSNVGNRRMSWGGEAGEENSVVRLGSGGLQSE